MASINRVMLCGYLGADPEIRRTQDGRPIANMRIATSESWRDKQTGERREKTEWHTIVCFSEGLCKVIEQYLAKGDQVYVSGQLQTRKWQDKEGHDRWSTEIVLKAFNSELTIFRCKKWEKNNPASGPTQPQSTPAPAGTEHRDDMDDEIPF